MSETLLRRRTSSRKYNDNLLDESQVHSILDEAAWSPSGGNTQPWKVVLLEPLPAKALREKYELKGWSALLPELWNLVETMKNAKVSPGEAYKTANQLVEHEGIIQGMPWLAVVYYEKDKTTFSAAKKIFQASKFQKSRIKWVFESVNMIFRINPKVKRDSVVCFLYSICLAATQKGVGSVIQYTYSNWAVELKKICGLQSSANIVGVVWLGHIDTVQAKSSVGRTRKPVDIKVIK